MDDDKLWNASQANGNCATNDVSANTYENALKRLVNILKLKASDNLKQLEDLWDSINTTSIATSNHNTTGTTKSISLNSTNSINISTSSSSTSTSITNSSSNGNTNSISKSLASHLRTTPSPPSSQSSCSNSSSTSNTSSASSSSTLSLKSLKQVSSNKSLAELDKTKSNSSQALKRDASKLSSPNSQSMSSIERETKKTKMSSELPVKKSDLALKSSATNKISSNSSSATTASKSSVSNAKTNNKSTVVKTKNSSKSSKVVLSDDTDTNDNHEDDNEDDEPEPKMAKTLKNSSKKDTVIVNKSPESQNEQVNNITTDANSCEPLIKSDVDSQSNTDNSKLDMDGSMNDSNESMQVEIDDMFSDMLDITCVVCKKFNQESNNKLIECRQCTHLYHQLCHTPQITNSEMESPNDNQANGSNTNKDENSLDMGGSQNQMIWYIDKCNDCKLANSASPPSQHSSKLVSPTRDGDSVPNTESSPSTNTISKPISLKTSGSGSNLFGKREPSQSSQPLVKSNHELSNGSNFKGLAALKSQYTQSQEAKSTANNLISKNNDLFNKFKQSASSNHENAVAAAAKAKLNPFASKQLTMNSTSNSNSITKPSHMSGFLGKQQSSSSSSSSSLFNTQQKRNIFNTTTSATSPSPAEKRTNQIIK